ncbi:MAG TPA: response regulator transcription factor [Spirochaetia bacterium]|nr:response regulator transcription factor [Spirochaetia bacterium]
MDRVANSLYWIRIVAYLSIVGVGGSLTLTGAPHLVWLWAGLVIFAAVLPIWPWVRQWPAWAWLALVLGEGVLVLAGQLVSGERGTLLALYFVLIPICARLPRRLSVLGYFTLPLLALVPFLVGPNPGLGWTNLVGIVPGFLAMVAFSEGFWAYRDALISQKKLLDELIATQRQVEGSPKTDPIAGRPGLTRRDREVLALVAQGFSNKEIAERLFLAEGTVKNRVSQILEKIGARDRTQAALRARDLGVI